MKFGTSFLQQFLEEIKKLKTPPLPVGIVLVATLSLVFWRDRNISSVINPLLHRWSELLHISPGCLYSFICLFLVPLLFLILTGQNPKHYGLSLGKTRLALPLFALFLVGFTVSGLFAGNLDSLRLFYGPGPSSPHDASLLFVTHLIYMWGWEFLNRGFLLLGLKRYVGVYAVYIQLIPFVILHLGKPPFELYGSIPFGLAFGFYAYLVDSFVYCVLVHACFALVINLTIGVG